EPAGRPVRAPHVQRQHQHLPTEPVRDLGDQLRSGQRRGVHPHLGGAGLQEPVHVRHRPHPAADGQRDGDRLNGTAHRLVRGCPLLHRRGDVEDGELVRARLLVGGGQLHRVAGVPQVAEPHPLDHPPRGHVQAGDHPDRGRHWTASARVANASWMVNAPAYRALPVMTPSTPSGSRAANARKSSRVDTPPEAITGASVWAHTSFSRSRLGPVMVPSRRMSVTTYRAQPARLSRSSTSSRSPPSRVQPRADRVRPRTSSPTATRSPYSATTRSHHSGFSRAAVPIFTRAAPVARAACSDSSSRIPPDSSTATSTERTTLASSLALLPRPNAAS